MSEPGERDYVLGTHDEEIARLGLQHRVWRQRALDAWIRAGFTHGQTLIDVGCGPGYASVDLAEIVGPRGRVVALDRSALKPGGVLVLDEYCDYATWRLAPRSPEHEEFVRLVMQSWRDAGGEPDIALELPALLRELGFEIRALRPIVDVVPPSSFVWQWPRAFIEVGLERLVELQRLSADRARQLRQSFLEREARPETLMLTPTVLEIVAARGR